MKQFTLILLCIFLSCFGAQAQWTPAGGNFYTTGNIGIGINNASLKKLHVQSNVADHIGIFENIHAGGYGLIINAANDPFRVGSLGNTDGNYLTVKSNGNVGIGITNPIAKLEVAVSGKSGIAVSGNSASYFGADLYVARSSTTADIGKGVVIQLSDEGSGNHNIIQTSPSGLQFCNYSGNVWTERMRLTTDGNFGIGTTTPDAKLAVKGIIHTQEVRVDMTGAMVPDYVFENDYNLPTLTELEAYIKVNKHLPEVPSACVVEEKGVNLGEMNMLLLKKVEELTLYMIEQNNTINELKKRDSELEKAIRNKK